MAGEVFPVARIDEYAEPCEPAIQVLRSAWSVYPYCGVSHASDYGRTTLNPSAFGATPYRAGVKKYRVPKIEHPSAHRTLVVCTGAFCQDHALLCICLWKRDSLLWGTASILTPVKQ